jgi:hypothetical protein
MPGRSHLRERMPLVVIGAFLAYHPHPIIRQVEHSTAAVRLGWTDTVLQLRRHGGRGVAKEVVELH